VVAVGRDRSPGPTVAAVWACPVPWGSCGRRGGVAVPLGLVWPPWGRGRSPGPRVVVWGRGRSAGPRVAAVGAWPLPWALCGRRVSVVFPLGPVWPPCWRGRSPRPRVAAVGAWPLPWAPCCRRGGVAAPCALCGCLGVVAAPMGPVWSPWGRGRSPGPRVAAVGAWPLPWAPCGRRGGVSGPVAPVWTPLGGGRSPGPRMAAVGAWPVPWAPYGRPGGVDVLLAPYGRRGGVTGPLGPVWPLWGRGHFRGPRMAAVGAWPVH